MNITFWIYALMISVSVVHALLAVVSIPLQGALMTDALGHAVLLGIVGSFFVVKSLTSPWLFVGALISAVCMHGTELFLRKYGKLNKDASMGIAFSLFFALAIILISLYARTIHLDIDMILAGNIEYALYDTVEGPVLCGPRMFWINLGAIALLSLGIYIFYRPLQICLFDKTYAKLRGLPFRIVMLLTVVITSYVVVSSLHVAGALILVGLSAAPYVALWTQGTSLKQVAFQMCIFSAVAACIAATIGIYANLSLSGTLAVVIASMALIFVFMRKK